MLKASLRAGSAVALVLAILPNVSAQSAPPVAPANRAPAAADPAANGQTDSGFRAKSLIGTSLSLEGGTQAGTVEDFVLSHEGVIEYLIVNNGGKLVTVPFEAAKFNWTQTTPTATLNINQQKYQSIPTYTTQQYPNFYAPTYRTEIYRAYGLTPGQNRRIERRIERRAP